MGRNTKAKYICILMASTMLGGVGAASAQDETPAAPPGDPAEVITVRGRFIPNEKRETSEISSVVDSQDFQIGGDADAAAALVRVTGITIQSGKFVYVRGLNERYSSATLNGSPLPSPEPLRRVAPLDLFPTSILANILVQKTYSPEYSAEFGGGAVDMRTTAVPSSGFVEIGASVGWDDTTTQHDGLLYQGSDSDWTGFDDGKRNYPSSFAGVLGVELVGSLPEAQREAIGEELVKDDTRMLIQQVGDVDPDGGVSANFGQRFDFSPDLSLGVTGALRFDSSWETREGVRRDVRPTDIYNDLRRRSTDNTIESSGLLGLGLDIADNHTLQLTALGTRSTSKEARSLEGNDVGSNINLQRLDTNEWFERQVWFTQLRGQHVFPALNDLSVEWRGSYSEAFRDAPFRTTIGYECLNADGTTLIPSERGSTCDAEGGIYAYDSRNSFDFSKIEDSASDYGVDVKEPFTVFGMEGELKFGAAHTEHSRDGVKHRFIFSGTVPDPDTSTPALNEFYTQRIDALFGPASIGPGLLRLDEIGGGFLPEAHTASLDVDALYFGIDVQLNPYIRAALGARYEDSSQMVNIFNQTEGDDGEVETTIESDPVLPAATITWNFTEDMQLRIGASQTITRPQFRELAYFEFVSPDTDTVYFGNPYLRNARLNNFDARWEYYFGRDQFVTAGVFYKDIKHPIEEALFPVGEGLSTTFINAPSATLQGVELEFEKVFDPTDYGFDRDGWIGRKDWMLRTNYTYTDSSVDANGTVLSCSGCSGADVHPTADPASAWVTDGRQLQGQSENIFNVSVGYEDPSARSRATVLYNYASDRIRAVETLGSFGALPAVIEQPPSSLDFVYSRDFDIFHGEFEFGFRATNLLGEDYEATQNIDIGNVVVDGYDRGRTYSISLRARY